MSKSDLVSWDTVHASPEIAQAERSVQCIIPQNWVPGEGGYTWHDGGELFAKATAALEAGIPEGQSVTVVSRCNHDVRAYQVHSSGHVEPGSISAVLNTDDDPWRSDMTKGTFNLVTYLGWQNGSPVEARSATFQVHGRIVTVTVQREEDEDLYETQILLRRDARDRWKSMMARGWMRDYEAEGEREAALITK